MKYDLKRLKEALDREIPAVAADENRIRQTIQKSRMKKQRATARGLTAAAAVVLLAGLTASLFANGFVPGKDYLDRKIGELSSGEQMQTDRTNEPTAFPANEKTLPEEAADDQLYSPDRSVSDFPAEEYGGEVVVQKTEEGKTVWNAIWNWAAARGEAGAALSICLTIWMLIRLGAMRKRSGIKHMLLTEAGWAAFAAGLLFISHREGTGSVCLWPTETAQDGAQGIALAYAFAAAGGVTGMIASWEWARKRVAAVLLSLLLFAGPWLFKAVCADMSVKEWRAASMLIFGWLIALLPFIWKSRRFRLFAAECRQAESQGICGLAGRRVWYALTLAAAVHFMLGVFLSGQELISFHQQIHIEEGAAERFGIDEKWIEKVQTLREEYLLSGQAEDVLCKAAETGEKEKAAAVRWMENNGIERLTEEMFVTVKSEGEIVLRQKAKTRMFLTLSEDDTGGYAQQLYIEALWSESGNMECETVVLLAPGKTLPLLEENVEIEQPSLSWLASQRRYRLEMGNVTMQDIEDGKFG